MDNKIVSDIPEDELMLKAEEEISSLKEEVRQVKTKVKIYSIITIIALITINIILIFVGALWGKAQLADSLRIASEELALDIEEGIKADVRQRITEDILKEYAGEHYLPEDYAAIGVYADRYARPSVVQVLCGMSNITERATGVILNTDGYVLTNTHVVTHKSEIPSGGSMVVHYKPYEQIKAIIQGNNSEYEMELIAFNPDVDLAIIKFKETPTGLTPATLVKADYVRRGEDVALIGNTIGYGLTVSVGAVSGFYNNGNMDIVLTDALALSGTSGAGLFNVYSQLVGLISVQLFSEQSGSMAGAISTKSIIEYIDEVNAQVDVNIGYTLADLVPGDQ
ncbi:MAG: serine protease [Clostridia bacterium]